MNCKVYSAPGVLWTRQFVGGGGGGDLSHESEHDLGMMVNDFLENGNSSVADSRYSSIDSDAALSDLIQLADKISYSKLMMDQYESDLFSVVNSLVLSITERELHVANSVECNANCIRFSLVKLLRLSGYNAGVCASNWQKSGRIPGGYYEYIDVIRYSDTGSTEHLIIDIDFRSHFEIARAVEYYKKILNSLPVIFVGSSTKLKQFLQAMVEAGRCSMKQNSMPLPPWRSLAYLQSKWQSPYQRKFEPEKQNYNNTVLIEHKRCGGHLTRLQSSLRSSFQSEIEIERMLKPLNGDKMVKVERGRGRNFRPL